MHKSLCKTQIIVSLCIILVYFLYFCKQISALVSLNETSTLLSTLTALGSVCGCNRLLQA